MVEGVTQVSQYVMAVYLVSGECIDDAKLHEICRERGLNSSYTRKTIRHLQKEGLIGPERVITDNWDERVIL